MPESTLVLAVAQTASFKGDVEANVRHHVFFVDQAAAAGAKFILFPELSITGYEPALADGLRLTPNDPRLESLKLRAQEHGMCVAVGAPYGTGPKPNIGQFCFQPDGRSLVYTKHHLHPGEEPFFEPGTDRWMLDLAGERLAPAICADTTHPEHPEQAAAGGATVYAASVLISERGYPEDTRQLQEYAARYHMVVLMANHSAPNGGWVPAGKSIAWDPVGREIFALPDTAESLMILHREAGTWFGSAIWAV